MSTPNPAMRAYNEIGVYSGVAYADPHQLISMLMVGALDRITRAKGALHSGQTALKGESVGAAITIVGGLKGCLDMEAGDELSNNLADLYDYMIRRLLEANAGNDEALLDEVASLLREIKLAWEAIPESAKQAHVRPRSGGTDASE